MDTSLWQHGGGAAVDWSGLRSKVKGFMSFAILKASDGTTDAPSPYFEQDYAQAHAAGLAVGTYHWAAPALPVVSSARSQAQLAYAIAGQPQPGDLPPTLDLERTGGLTPPQLTRWVLAYLSETKRLTGRTPLLYSYPYFITTHLLAAPALADYPLSIADYGLSLTEPDVPKPWTSWMLWQYSSQGDLAPYAVNNTVDLDVFGGSTTQWNALLGQARGQVQRSTRVALSPWTVSAGGNTLLAAVTGSG